MTFKEIVKEFDRIEKNGYDFDSDLWDILKSNRHQLSKLQERFEDILMNADDEFILNIAIWGLFWNDLEIKPKVLNRVKSLFMKFSDDFELKNRILGGLGIKYSNTRSEKELEFLNDIAIDTNEIMDLRCSARISTIKIKYGLPLSEILLKNDLTPFALSEQYALDKLNDFKP